ncbi:phosphoribosylaminoimidazolesuccinocarboxamide synthase [Candidatus Woesearchaeota archaeon]|nr:phosphoribosylaminoimidazolesuccinocarboxamide synthase [Candidatus Woesearchaeota archaeon]
MSLGHLALAKTDDLPIKHVEKVHSGKVRSVYWLSEDDSYRLIHERNYDIHPSSQLGVMVVSDRLSAFDCNWQAESGLQGVPGKGAVLNTLSEYWFSRLTEEGIGSNHLLEAPHPLVWIVQKARPVLVEAVARQYLTGTLWRAYEKGVRHFCGTSLPDGMHKDQAFPELILTPTTKGTVRGISTIPEEEDTPISVEQIRQHLSVFQVYESADLSIIQTMLTEGFSAIAQHLSAKGMILVDTKMEFGYALARDSALELIFIDEMVTPDSSRLWDADAYQQGRVIENSKEGFRQFLLSSLERDVLLSSHRFAERKNVASTYRVPVEQFLAVSDIYRTLAEKITGQPLPNVHHPREEIIDVMASYRLLRDHFEDI